MKPPHPLALRVARRVGEALRPLRRPPRAMALVLAALLAWAAGGALRQMRGDWTAFALPPPRSGLEPAQMSRAQELLRRAIARSPFQWEHYLKNANYLSLLGRSDLAIEELARSRQFYLAMGGLEMQARLEMGRGEQRAALDKFLLLRRISVVDRRLFANLVVLLNAERRWEELARAGREAEMRWPGERDTLVCLGNVAIAGGDLELGLKYLRLALATEKERRREGFPLEAVRKTADDAARTLGYRHGWARPGVQKDEEESATPGGAAAKGKPKPQPKGKAEQPAKGKQPGAKPTGAKATQPGAKATPKPPKPSPSPLAAGDRGWGSATSLPQTGDSRPMDRSSRA